MKLETVRHSSFPLLPLGHILAHTHTHQIPTTVSEELEYNPFMLTHSDMVREALGLPPSTEQVDVLIALRQRKDDFKPITCFP